MDASPEIPPCFWTFNPAYELRDGAGRFLAERLGDPDCPTGAASRLDFSTASAETRVREGTCAGMSFPELVERYGLLAAGAQGLELARRGLAFEVRHAGADIDSELLAHARAGKPEDAALGGPASALITLDAMPGAAIYHGRRNDLSRERFLAAYRSLASPETLEPFSAFPGSVIAVPPRTPFALGKGVLAHVASVRSAAANQLSWHGGLGDKVIDPAPVRAPEDRLFIESVGHIEGMNAVTWLYATDLFIGLRLDLRREWVDRWSGTGARRGPVVLSCRQGGALVIGRGQTESLGPGSSLVVSAACEEFSINPGEEGASIIKTWLPDPVIEFERALAERDIGQRQIEGLFGFHGRQRL